MHIAIPCLFDLVFVIVRRRMMMDFEAGKYANEWDCTFQIVRSEGVLALWAGVGTNIIRSVIARIVLQCCCDLSDWLFVAFSEKNIGDDDDDT